MKKKTYKQLMIADIIAKSLYAKITDHEKMKLNQWIEESDQNARDYKRLIASPEQLVKNKTDNKVDVFRAKQKVLAKLEYNKTSKSNKKWLKYAAIFIGLVGVTFFIENNIAEKPNQIIEIHDDDITLELENGDIKVISAEGDEYILGKNGNLLVEKKGNRLNYTGNKKYKKIVYNTLSIPYGKKFELLLSDGTEVFLNAGTTLKYPVKFIKGRSRTVYLEGEAYFKVAHDDADSFDIHTNRLNTKVFGTSFNVSAYPEDIDTKVVLVEGKVGVYKTNTTFNKANDSYLLPNQMASLGDDKEEITTTEVDPSLYTSWMNNMLIFKRESFENIFHRLERHYNVEIINNSDLFEGEKFTGTFNDIGIEYLMDVLKTNMKFTYQIIDNKIIINP